jgi:plasmid stabilization system protein ParE
VKRYRFHREALDAYELAIAYYERARPGLGESFILEVDRVIALTLEFPESGAPAADTPPELGIRRRLVQRFSVEIDYQGIWRLHHCARGHGGPRLGFFDLGPAGAERATAAERRRVGGAHRAPRAVLFPTMREGNFPEALDRLTETNLFQRDFKALDDAK